MFPGAELASSATSTGAARPPGRPLPAHIRRGNARRSRDRAPVEHVFSVQKQATVGLARARTRVGTANLAYNLQRLV